MCTLSHTFSDNKLLRTVFVFVCMYVHAYYTHVYCMCVCYRTYIICTVVHVYMCIFMSINVCACVFGSVGGEGLWVDRWVGVGALM